MQKGSHGITSSSVARQSVGKIVVQPLTTPGNAKTKGKGGARNGKDSKPGGEEKNGKSAANRTHALTEEQQTGKGAAKAIPNEEIEGS